MDKNSPTPHRNEGRRLKITAGVLARESLAQIGREEGVSRQTIWKQLASSDARQIVVALTNREIDRISALFSQMLQVIAEGLEARRVQVQDGAVIDLGPDHYARLTWEILYVYEYLRGHLQENARPHDGRQTPTERRFACF